jgi:hypothetical protein
MVGCGEEGMERFRARMARPSAESAAGGEQSSRAAAGGGRSAQPPATPPSYPNPFDDTDTLMELEDRILEIFAHVELAEYRSLPFLAEFDARRGWELGGHASCAHWLAVRAKLGLGAAREKVRVAKALEDLPETSAWMALGRISFSQARALTRVADADNEAELLQAAEDMTVAQIERMVRGGA